METPTTATKQNALSAECTVNDLCNLRKSGSRTPNDARCEGNCPRRSTKFPERFHYFFTRPVAAGLLPFYVPALLAGRRGVMVFPMHQQAELTGNGRLGQGLVEAAIAAFHDRGIPVAGGGEGPDARPGRRAAAPR